MRDVLAIVILVGILGLACYVVYFFATTFYRGIRSLIYGLRNSFSPAKSYPARVVAKRTETSGRIDQIGQIGGYIDTYYFVTFEFKNGVRREYEVSGPEFGQAIEGDQGNVIIKGTRYENFERDE